MHSKFEFYKNGALYSHALYLAVKIGLFEMLDQTEHTLPQICQSLSRDQPSFKAMVGLLVAMEVIKEKKGKYKNSESAQTFLIKNSPGYIGDFLVYQHEELLPAMASSGKKYILENHPWPDPPFSQLAEVADKFYHSTHHASEYAKSLSKFAIKSAIEAQQCFPFENIKKVVDIGGNDGSFLITLLNSQPHLQGIIFDLPAVREAAEKNIHEHGLEKRLSFVAGNFFENQIPQGDLYSLGQILHDWPDKFSRRILQNLRNCMSEGNTLMIREILLDHPRNQLALAAANFTLTSYAAQGFGAEGEKTSAQMHSFLFDAGFQVMNTTFLDALSYIIAKKIPTP